jgi:hypothetical protein
MIIVIMRKAAYNPVYELICRKDTGMIPEVLEGKLFSLFDPMANIGCLSKHKAEEA